MKICGSKMSVPGARCNTVWSCQACPGTLEGEEWSRERNDPESGGSWGPPSGWSNGWGGAFHVASLNCPRDGAMVGSRMLDQCARQSLPVMCTRDACARVCAHLGRLAWCVIHNRSFRASHCAHIPDSLQSNEAYLTFTVGQIREN